MHMPLDKAAERIGISAAELGAQELNGVHLPFTDLEHLSTVYHRPVAAFLYPEPPAEPPFPTDHRTSDSQAHHPLSADTVLAIRFAQRVQEPALELAALTGDTLASRIPSAALSDDPDSAARSIRAALGVSLHAQAGWRSEYDSLNGWTASVEALGVYVLRQKMPWRETRGFVLSGQPPVIVLNSEDSANGRVFSLMHELTHLALTTSSVCDMRFAGYDAGSRSIEVFCNRVAGSVLVPPDALLSAIGTRSEDPSWSDRELATLARHFGVSQEAVLRRLLIVGKTDDQFYNEWRERDEERFANWRTSRRGEGWQPAAPKALGENGNRFTTQVLHAESVRLLSAGEAAQFLNVGTRHIDKMRELLR